MSRIRTLKPEWLDDEKLGAISDAARLLSVALILLSDDHGRGRANPVKLGASVWGFSADLDLPRRTAANLRELLEAGFVRLYAVRGQAYFEICNWRKHQRIDNAGKPRWPGPEEADPAPPPPTQVPPDSPPGNRAAETLAATRGETRPDRDPDLDQDLDHDRRRDVAAASHPGSPRSASARAVSPEVAFRVAALESRYPGELLNAARAACARNRKSGRMAPSLWLATLEKLEAFTPEVVVPALATFVDRYGTGEHDERYLLGIVRGEVERGRKSGGWRPPTTQAEYADSATKPAELVQLFGDVTDEDRARIERLGNRRAHG